MGIQVQPELENQPNNPPINPDTTNNITTEPVNPPAPAPAPVEDVNTVRNMFTSVLQETNARAKRAEDELAELRRQQSQPRTTPEQDVDLLTSNPAALIRREIDAALAPIRAQSQEFSKANNIAIMKTQMANDQRFPLVTNQVVSGHMDSLLQSNPNPDANAMMVAYYTAVGLFVANGGSITPQALNNPPPVNPSQPTIHSQTVPTPPNPRPSPPAPPRTNNTPVRRQLNENEKYLAKNIYHMTDDEYLDMMDVPAGAVITSTIGEPKKP